MIRVGVFSIRDTHRAIQSTIVNAHLFATSDCLK